MQEQPIKMVCPECGSEDIAKDAVAKWNSETQEWELCGTHCHENCADCEAKGDRFAARVPTDATFLGLFDPTEFAAPKPIALWRYADGSIRSADGKQMHHTASWTRFNTEQEAR